MRGSIRPGSIKGLAALATCYVVMQARALLGLAESPSHKKPALKPDRRPTIAHA